MKKYDLKNDLKNISYTLSVIFTILLIFAAFSVIILFPIYFFTKTYPRIYSLIASFFLLSVLFFFTVKRAFKIWNKYKKLKPFFVHLLLSPFTVFSVLLLLSYEYIIFKLVEYFFSLNSTNLFFLIQIICFILTGVLLLYNIYFTSALTMIIVEICAFKIFFEIFHFITAIILIVVLSLLIIIGVIFLRVLIHTIKIYLKNNLIN
jgi:hypothetical protein